VQGACSHTQRVAVNAAASGNNTLVAAVAGRKIRVLSAVLVAAGTVSPKFQSGTGATDLTGAMPMVANGVIVLPFNPEGWAETLAGALLNLNLNVAISVTGVITYVEVT
jgi:hypothetical protein